MSVHCLALQARQKGAPQHCRGLPPRAPAGAPTDLHVGRVKVEAHGVVLLHAHLLLLKVRLIHGVALLRHEEVLAARGAGSWQGGSCELLLPLRTYPGGDQQSRLQCSCPSPGPLLPTLPVQPPAHLSLSESRSGPPPRPAASRTCRRCTCCCCCWSRCTAVIVLYRMPLAALQAAKGAGRSRETAAMSSGGMCGCCGAGSGAERYRGPDAPIARGGKAQWASRAPPPAWALFRFGGARPPVQRPAQPAAIAGATMQGPSEGDELSQLAPNLRAAARAPSPANAAALREYIQVRPGTGRRARRPAALNNATARQLSTAGAPSSPAGAGGEARQPARGVHRAPQAARRQRAPPPAPLLHHQVAVSAVRLARGVPGGAGCAPGSRWLLLSHAGLQAHISELLAHTAPPALTSPRPCPPAVHAARMMALLASRSQRQQLRPWTPRH